MLWKNEPGKEEKLTPWIIGAVALVIVAVATYMNYGDQFFHHGPATDISATSKAADPAQ